MKRRPMARGAETDSGRSLEVLAERIVDCRACDRLVAWREQVARERRAAFAGEVYWGRPVAGHGDPSARVLFVGLAPAAHGANRTGRMFTGDRSGDWLYGALHHAGFANQATSVRIDDGLILRDAFVSAVVRCAPPNNRPRPDERDRCLPFLAEELVALRRLRVVVAFGGFAWDGVLRALGELGHRVRPRPSFTHGATVDLGALVLLGSYHPSQQNTFTGRLTREMLASVMQTARRLAGRSPGDEERPGP